MPFTTETIDATNQTLGRIATHAANILRGKNKASFNPAAIPNVKVCITNVSKLRFTGKKLDQKKYYHFSGYPGGLRGTLLKEMRVQNPERMVRLAVYGMLPDNKLRKRLISRLTIKP